VSRKTCQLARASVAIVLAACVMGENTASPVVIQLRVVEGEGTVYAVGSRATRGLMIKVSDENGKPVDSAAVSFQLPADGPSGVFGGGIKTAIVTTKPDGMATIWGMQWNKIPGPFEIKVTASKGPARSSLVVAQFLADAKAAPGEGTFTASHRSRNMWLLIGAIGAAAGAGLAFRGSSSKTAVAAAPTLTPIQIGNPTIIVGHP
jgi:hypothetical protein